MKASRIVFALIAICGSLSLAYTPAQALESGWHCHDCVLSPDGTASCAYCH
jgi:hypothetical protein